MWLANTAPDLDNYHGSVPPSQALLRQLGAITQGGLGHWSSVHTLKHVIHTSISSARWVEENKDGKFLYLNKKESILLIRVGDIIGTNQN